MTVSQSVKKWLPLVVLSLALTIIIVDTTVLNVSLKAIVSDLRANIQDIQWAITAYALVVAAFTIAGGRLGDFFGRKKMFMLGAVVFALGSLLTSASTSVGMMIFMRVIQGAGACLILPATVSLIVTHYRQRDRQIAFGVWGGLAAASAAIGPLLGGWLTTYWSWRWAFRINLGVAALLLLGSWAIRESRESEEKIWIDYGGIALSALGLLSIVYGIIESSTYGWWAAKQSFVLFGYTVTGLGTISVVPAFIIIGLVFLELFVLWESRVQRQGNTPLVSFSLFKNRQFSVAVAVTAILALVQTGVFFSLPVFLQGVKRLNALQTGVALLPMTLAILVAAPFAAYIAKHITPKRIIQSGMVLNALGFFVMRGELGVQSSPWALVPGFIITGMGMGFLFSQTTNMALSAVSVQQSGEASGINTTLRQLGASLGSAILGAVLLSVVSTSLAQGVQASIVIPDPLKPVVARQVQEQSKSIEITGPAPAANEGLPPAVGRAVAAISDQATVDGNRAMLAWGVVFVLLGLVVSSWLPNTMNIERSQSAAR